MKYCAGKECGAGTMKQERKDCKYCGGTNFTAGHNPDPPSFLENRDKSKDVKVFASTQFQVFELSSFPVFRSIALSVVKAQ